MLIVGAGGLASQLYDDIVLSPIGYVFWSEKDSEYKFITKRYKLISTEAEVKDHFNSTGREFVTGIWDIHDRKRLTDQFIVWGGILVSWISPVNYLSSLTEIGAGTMVLHKAATEPGVCFGRSCIINKRSNFGHGAILKDYCSIGPFVIVGSNSIIEENVMVGMGAIIQPGIKVGKNAIVTAGAVVTKNIPENAVVSGVPAGIRFFRKLDRV